MGAAALGLAGCSGDIRGGGGSDPVSVSSDLGELTVTKPLRGAMLSSRAIQVEGAFKGDADEIIVNGSARFKVDEQGLFKGSMIVDDEGAQNLAFTVVDLKADVGVTIDSLAPEIVLDSPDSAGFVRGEDARFTGHVTDAHLKSFKIGDDTVRVAPDGSFDHQIPVAPGAHRIRIEATDELGHVGYAFSSFISGSFVSTYSMHPNSVVVKLGSNAINAIKAAMLPKLTSDQISVLLIKNNPAIEQWWGRIDFLGERHELLTVTLTPQNGYIDVRVAMLNTTLPYRLDHALPGVITGDITVGYFEAHGKLAADVYNGKPRAWLTALDVELLDFFVDMRGWPDIIDKTIISGIAVNHVKEALRGHLAVGLPKAVDEALAGLPTSGDVSVMGHTATISGEPSLIGISAKGLRAVLDMNIRAKERDWDLTSQAPGPLVLGRGPVPTSGTSPDIEASVSLDLVNSAAYAAWSTGGLRHRLTTVKLKKDEPDPLTVSALALLIPGVKRLAKPEAPIHVDIHAALPPLVMEAPNALVRVHIPDVRVTFIAAGGADDGSDVDLFTVSIGASAPVGVHILNDVVTVRVGELEFDADPVGTPPAGMKEGEELDTFILELAKPYIQQYSEIGGLKIPSVMGFKISATNAALDAGYFRANGKLYYTAR